MRGELLKLSIFAHKKLFGRRTVNRSEIPHYAYTRPLCVSVKKPTAQTAHLAFADTRAKAEKPKELFFANARTENETETVNLETE